MTTNKVYYPGNNSTGATLLYDCFPGTLTINPPSQFVAGASNAPYYVRNGGPCPNDYAVVCWQRFTGTDARTGFVYPSTSPLFAYNGGSIEGFGMYVTDQYYGMNNPGDTAGYNAVIGISQQTSTVRGSSIATLKANHYNHAQNGYQSGVQSHFMLYRDTAAVGFVDLSELHIDTWIKIPDQSSLLNSTYKFRVIHDYKTTGDFRYVIQIIYADSADAAAFGVSVGTVGLMFTADNNAGGVSPFNEFIRMKSYSVNIPVESFFKSSCYWKRAANSSDISSGRFVYLVNDVVVFDVNVASVAAYNSAHPLACTGNSPATDCVNTHMGVNNNPWQRLFLVSNYFGGIGGNDVQFELARLRIWDKSPIPLPLRSSIN